MSCVAQAGFKLHVAKDDLELLPPGYVALELEAMALAVAVWFSDHLVVPAF